jgi:hypothetical protein
MKLSELKWSGDMSCNFMTPHGVGYIDRDRGKYIALFYGNTDGAIHDDIVLDDLFMVALFLVSCTPLPYGHPYYDAEAYPNAEPVED